jgi:FkbM family methyltransferase
VWDIRYTLLISARTIVRQGRAVVRLCYIALGGRGFRRFLRSVRLRIARGALVRNGGIIEQSSGTRIHVDPADPRAWRLKVSGGYLMKRQKKVWRRLVEQIKPTLIIDVGGNYGEVGLSARYPRDARVHFVEPNPGVAKYLKRTCSENISNAVVHQVAASNTNEAGYLCVPSSSSGLGSLGVLAHGRQYEVAKRRIEEEIEAGRTDTVLFKVDVEGHEMEVLEGMESIFEEAFLAVGLCEIWSASDEKLIALFEKFDVWLVTKRGSAIEADVEEVRGHLREVRTFRQRYLQDVILQYRPTRAAAQASIQQGE